MESFDGTDAVIETLRTRGWSFSDLEQIGAMIAIQSAMADDGTLTADFVEKELVNMDLRSIGAKSLPEPTLFRKSTYLHGPKVLQISSARDISRNSIERVSGSSSSRRLLRLGLTDGHSEIVAVEFSHIPSLPDNVVPGTKVRLENKAPVRSGIVCLNSKVITVLGGVVQSLHEEWKMNQKYAGLARASLRISQEGDIGGPPQFEKLQIGPPSRRLAQQGRNSNNLEPASSSNGGPSSKKAIRNDFRPTGKHLDSNSKMDHSNNSSDKAPQSQSTEEKPSSSERPKEVAESGPVQNQAAAQKLLQKMNQPNNDRYSRGRRQKGRAWQEEEQQVFTLEEYEKRKAGAQPIVINERPDTRRDEELAWRMQNQFDLEDSHVQRSHPGGEAENIRMNMFSYERDDDRDGGMGYGGRGRGGRGRGRGGGGRGRGRGGGRGRGRSY